MAIDFDATFNTIHALQNRVDALLRVVSIAKMGKVIVDIIGDIEFDPAQKALLKAEYQAIKAELTALYQELP